MLRASGKVLNNQLRPALGRPHDVGRAYSLVGGNEHEGFHPGVERGLRQSQGAHDVVAHTLDHIGLDQRHMLVGRRVVDGFHPLLAEDLLHQFGILHRPKASNDRTWRDATQHPLDLVQRVFAGFQQHQP